MYLGYTRVDMAQHLCHDLVKDIDSKAIYPSPLIQVEKLAVTFGEKSE